MLPFYRSFIICAMHLIHFFAMMKHSVKVVGTVDSPANHLIAVLNEVDLLPSFMTMVKIWVAPLMQVSKFSKVIWMKLKMPPCFDDRDVCFNGTFQRSCRRAREEESELFKLI
jgi:hypothetical protein